VDVRAALREPRTLDGQRAVTVQQWCTACPARPWQDCAPEGNHLARWYAALHRDLVTGREMALAVEAAGTGRADAIVPLR
jgi:hypothetical protein